MGIKNALKPTLQAFAELTNNGLTGAITALGEQASRAWDTLAGGYGNLLGEIFRRNYPNYSGGNFAEHPAAQSRRAIRLRDQPTGAAAERAGLCSRTSTRCAWTCRTR